MNPQAIGKIPPQRLTTTVLDGSVTCLVDDTVRLVNDATVLTGSQASSIDVLRVSTSSNAPVARINKRR